MKNMTIIMLEDKEQYGKRLAAYISRQADSPFNVCLYLEHPASAVQWKKADAILLSSGLMELYGKDVDRQRLLVLDEEGKGDGEDYQAVYKYQSAAVIYRTLLAFCVDKSGKRLMGTDSRGKNWMITGIYSPVGGRRITQSVLSMCRSMAAERKLLYLNMEQVPGFLALLPETDRREGISELIYYVKQGSRNLGARLGMMAVRDEFDYLLPPFTPSELGELTGDEWRECMDCIRSETDYEWVVIDFGASAPPAGLAGICMRWIAVSSGGEWEHQLIGRFRDILGRLTEDGQAVEIDEMSPDDLSRGIKVEGAG